MTDYGKLFQGTVAPRSVEKAAEAIARIDDLYWMFILKGDSEGLSQCLLCALVGREGARRRDYLDIAEMYQKWMLDHV